MRKCKQTIVFYKATTGSMTQKTKKTTNKSIFFLH